MRTRRSSTLSSRRTAAPGGARAGARRSRRSRPPPPVRGRTRPSRTRTRMTIRTSSSCRNRARRRRSGGGRLRRPRRDRPRAGPPNSGQRRSSAPLRRVRRSRRRKRSRLSSWLPPPGSFGSQLLGHDRAPVESSQQRSQGWSLNALPRDRPVWAHVRKEDQGGFWWPARLDCAHWEKPLRVKLYLDTAASILEFTTETITFDSPDHDDLATFRNPTKLRFDKHTFRDSADGASPSNDAFDRVLETAIVTDAGLDDEDDEEALLPPSSLGTSGAKASSQSREQEGNESSSSEEKGVKELVEEEDEEWLEGGGEDAGMTFPFVCLARDKRTWWAARAARYEPPPSPTKNGAKRAVSGKFVVEWTDGSYGKVTRKNLLTPTDPAFFTVKLGETELDIPKSYIPKLREFCTTSLPKRFQKVIDEDLALAQPFNDAFFAGGFKRDQLAKKSAFGEMSSEALAVVEDSISRWARGELSDDGERPHGSPRYEALEPSERSQYGVDVLLSIAVALNYVDDEGLAERAEAQLKERGVDEPSEDAVEEEAFKIARGELDLRSATKTVLAMRQLRQINDASRKQKAKESRTKSR
ncbi:hypothetical protein DMC30DRAFT_141045 [Rhodotorula diobovata]|uniref:PWWP domain-containing protein n=1 Tax=Rhodotorula diobovata TaxID=5288 RepID=A0A5C5G2G8_9BASI|nr:hypothetical protein DMC30DRAFT_141045 [Rhodotorula diobovata]